ncbi:helix-turn-helix domain-containing protein [Camelimonas fluminis]|uniref:Helix-turn-helix domain-containing protein n=1 Tax=Camelimonas fluminis TaxID=1576911 RepID=A0ABV7ULB9_9HYPH
MGEFIDQNLLNPALGPELIAQECGVSRAHLYRSFSLDGGVTKLIRDRHLDVAHQELTRTNGTKRSITEIVYACGFSDTSVFLRNFKNRFGMIPSQFRKIRVPLRERNTNVLKLHNHLTDICARYTFSL